MMRIRTVLVGITAAVACAQPQSQRTDPLQPLRLVAGRVDSVLVSDLFYARDYSSVRIGSIPAVEARLDSTGHWLILEPDAHAEGWSLLPMQVGRQTLYLPLRIERLQPHTFRYRPGRPVQSVTVMGSFNDWNRSRHALRNADGDGTFQLRLELEPGRYEYKFVVDGREIADPSNPDSVSNPFGSYNSVLTVPPRHPHPPRLHLLQVRPGAHAVHMTWVADGPTLPNSLAPHQLLVLLDNQAVPASWLRVRGRRISVNVPRARLKGVHALRVALTHGGAVTPLHHIFLYDGRPFGNNDHPFVWQDAVLYSLLIDRFFDGDSSNSIPVQDPRLPDKTNYMGGDLQGLLMKIEEGYFDSLGVNLLWISPVNDNTDRAHPEWPPPHRYFSGYHGYWPVHHQRVEERFGDMTLLRQVVQAAHRHGIRILLDFIANHVHEDHPFYRRHRDWFGTVDLPDGRKNIRLWDEHRLTTWFEPFLPSFDYLGSQAALDTMTDNALWWLEQTGADGFRHDAVKHIPNHFWRTLTRKIRERYGGPQGKPIFQIGETFGSYDMVSSYVNHGQLDAQFNFNLYYTARYVFLTPDADFAILQKELEKTIAVYGLHNVMGNIMDSHDQVRYMAFADGDLPLDAPDAAEVGWTHPPQVDNPISYQKARLYLTYLMTIPGLPALYYGDEIGMTGAADPDNRRMMRFGRQLTGEERAMLKFTREMVHLRRKHPALRYGDFHVIHADRSVFAYLRTDPNERLLIVLNKRETPQEVQLSLPAVLPLRTARRLDSRERQRIANGILHVQLAPLSAQIFVLEPSPVGQ